MRESVTYQDILAEGEVKGLERGRSTEARLMVIRLLTRKLGNIPSGLIDRVNNLPIDRLESLGEALLDFTTITDLENFLG